MKPKILVVDDSALARRMMRSLLEEMGCEVDEAADGAQALERFYLNPPSLVMLDMVMSGMYGLDVLSRMRELNPDVQVIVVTADIQKSTADQAKALGARGVINKPVSREGLNALLRSVVDGGRVWN